MNTNQNTNQQQAPAQMVSSTSDARTINNVMRHEYKVLSDSDKKSMRDVKGMGLKFYELLQSIGSHPKEDGKDVQFSSRELSLAAARIEEAVMWAVKHITK